MSAASIPGTLCVETQPWLLQDGTSPLLSAPLPGVFCVELGGFRKRAPWLVPVDADVGALFRACLNPLRGIARSEFEAAAAVLGVEVEAIEAVADVETKSAAFEPMGRPTILFERHYFHDLTEGRFDADHADISSAAAGKYGSYAAQYKKLEEAYSLDGTAALQSASWGRFQIMGRNFKEAGFSSVRRFVKAHMTSESAHLQAFVSFVQSDSRKWNALKAKDWATFARWYNGKGYKKNDYDNKMKSAYEKLVKARQPEAKPAGAAASGSARGARPQ